MHPRFHAFAFAAACLLAPPLAHAHDHAASHTPAQTSEQNSEQTPQRSEAQIQGHMEFHEVYARSTTPGIQNSAVWFSVTHTGTEDDRIIGASSEVAERAEIHDMKMEGDVMRMFQIDGIDLTAGKNFQLGQGNKLHIMLMGLKQPLKVGEQFTLHVQFEKAGVLPVQVTVRDIKSRGHGAGGHGKHGEHDKHGDGHAGHSEKKSH